MAAAGTEAGPIRSPAPEKLSTGNPVLALGSALEFQCWGSMSTGTRPFSTGKPALTFVQHWKTSAEADSTHWFSTGTPVRRPLLLYTCLSIRVNNKNNADSRLGVCKSRPICTLMLMLFFSKVSRRWFKRDKLWADSFPSFNLLGRTWHVWKANFSSMFSRFHSMLGRVPYTARHVWVPAWAGGRFAAAYWHLCRTVL